MPPPHAKAPRHTLLPPARYFPPRSGRYEVKTGLHALGTDFGNGTRDGQVFQLDNRFPAYRAAKVAARTERLDKYFARLPGTADLERAASRWVLETLVHEHPREFAAHRNPAGATCLDCRLTGESLYFDSAGDLHGAEATGPDAPPYASTLDALAMQVQEDIALLTPDAAGRYRLVLLHLCLPNHWAAEDKLGSDFAAMHAPVPDMNHINRSADTLLERIGQGAGPFVRFAWGIATDDRLNHHPEAPLGTEAARWQGRRFDPARPRAWLRVERQVLAGIDARSDIRPVLFTIRTYHYPLAELADDDARREALMGAVRSMSEAALAYKGLEADRDALLAWLDRGAPRS